VSHYTTGSCQITDPPALIDALAELGFTPEVHAAPATLYGYQGDARPEKAHVILRRQQVGSASNDIGFLFKADGTCEVIISEFDRRQGYTDAWVKKVTMLSAVHRAIAVAKQQGHEVLGRKVNAQGKIELRVRV
jgi:hypothetical protein